MPDINRAKARIREALSEVEEHEFEQSAAYWQGYLQQTLKSLLTDLGGE